MVVQSVSLSGGGGVYCLKWTREARDANWFEEISLLSPPFPMLVISECSAVTLARDKVATVSLSYPFVRLNDQ